MKKAKGSLPPRWTVGRARAQFAGLLKAAERAPQEIYHRNRLRAVVVHPESARVAGVARASSRPATLAEAYAEIRRICKETGYKFPQIARWNRPNAFLIDHSRRSR